MHDIPTTVSPPGPPQLPLLGNLLSLRGDFLERYVALVDEYGDVVHLQLGPMSSFVLADPEHAHYVLVKNQKNYIKGMGYDGLRLILGQGLITSEQELWRQQRRLMQPKFTPKATLNFADMMAEVTQRLLDRWQPIAEANGILQMDGEMFRLTMSVISRALFSIDLDDDLTEVGRAVRDAFAFVPERTMSVVNLPLSVPLPKHRSFNQSLQIINEFIDEQIAAAQQPGARENLLGVLLDAQDEETGRQMDAQQLRDEVVTLFFAGFETTARSLTWAWYLLAGHPDVMVRLAAEADEVLGGRLPTVSDLYQLTYTRMVIDETLRLYPPTALLARQNVEDDEIGGYPIPAGSMVTLIPYLVHRHPSEWHEPERFDPERFTAEAVSQRPKYAYIPFASGPRICLGNNFALLEMTLALAMTLARYRLAAASSEPIPGEFRGTLVPARSLEMRIANRYDSGRG